MTSQPTRAKLYYARRTLRVLAIILLALSLAACAQFMARFGKHPPPPPPTTVVTPPKPVEPPPAPVDVPLPRIIAGLQQGHYADGESSLRQYLQLHPGDKSAEFMLRQLTEEPARLLGARWRPYVVAPGDSYSGLAGRQLGNANLFLALARYNGSTNPSLLLVGETLHMPILHNRLADADDGSSSAAKAAAATPAETPTARAQRLQGEGVALFEHGQQDLAVARLDQALTLDPGLPSSGAEATALRRKLLDTYHERAIVLYRDQHLDQAIALWDRALAIDPGYEPATVYRARALELKKRLQQY